MIEPRNPAPTPSARAADALPATAQTHGQAPAPDHVPDPALDQVPDPPTPPTAAPSRVAPPRPAATGAGALLRGTSWQTLAQVVPLIANLVVTPYVIHGLGSARFGVFLLVASFANLLGQFDGGVGASALRFCTLYAGRDDRVATTRLLSTVSAAIVGLSALVTVLTVVFTTQILGFFKVAPEYADEAAVLLRVLTALIGIILWRNLYHAVLAARHQFRAISIAYLAGAVVYSGGLVMAAAFGWDLTAIALVMVLQQLVASLITIPSGLRYLDRRGVRWAPRQERREFFSYAWKVQLSGIVMIAVSQKDQLVAGRVVSAQESGPFSQGYGLAYQLRSLPANAMKPIQAVTGAEVGAYGAAAAASRIEEIQRVWVIAVTGWCAVGVPAGYVAVRAWLPDSFALTGTVVAILFAGHFFTLLTLVATIWALTLGCPGMDLRAATAGFVVNLALSVLLGLAFGMIGVVAATAAGQFAAMLYFSWDARRRLPTRIRWFMRDVPWPAGALAAGVATACELVAAPHLPRGVLGLLAAGLVALPALGIYVMTSLRGPDLQRARRLLGRRT